MAEIETNRNYEEIDQPYNGFLERSEQTDNNGSVETQPVKSDGGMADLWIKNFVRSENWKPKSVGFYLDGQRGYAEFADVFVSGEIQALTGIIGGFEISATTISATNLILTSGVANTANISVGTGSNLAGMNSADAAGDIAFWAGNTFANRASAPFRVTAAGSLVASSATITGTINATSGTFSGTITVSGTLSGGNITGATITGGTIRTSAGDDRVEMNGANNSLYVYSSGEIRGGFTGFSLFFNGPFEIAGGSIFSNGSNQLNFSVSGASDLELNENDFGPLTDGAISTGGFGRWLNVFTKFLIATGTADPSSGDSDQDGSMYYNTSTDELRVRKNGTWRSVTTS